MRTLPLLVLLASAAMACSPILTMEGGYFDRLSQRPGHGGGTVNVRAGMYNPHLEPAHGPTVGASIGVRTKFSDYLTQVALTEDFVLLPFAQIDWLTPFLRAGMNVYQFESLDDAFAFGMFSPYAEGGAFVQLWRDADDSAVFLSLSAGLEYDVRFTDQPNEGYWLGMLGIGLGGPPWEPPWDEDLTASSSPPSPTRP